MDQVSMNFTLVAFPHKLDAIGFHGQPVMAGSQGQCHSPEPNPRKANCCCNHNHRNRACGIGRRPRDRSSCRRL